MEKDINKSLDLVSINTFQVPGEAGFENFDEIKILLLNGLERYNNAVYSNENIDLARSDLKVLRELKKKLTNHLKFIENQYNEPLKIVQIQFDELINLINVPLKSIDAIIKEIEKSNKLKRIYDYAKEKSVVLGDYSKQVLDSNSFFNEKWLNKTYSDKRWKNDVDDIIHDAKTSINTIKIIGKDKEKELTAFYLDRLSLDGMDSFLNNIADNNNCNTLDVDGVEKTVIVKLIGQNNKIDEVLQYAKMVGIDVQFIESEKSCSFDEIRREFPMAYMPWTDEEDDALKYEYEHGVDIATMAEMHERKTGAIRSRLRKLGLEI